MNARYFSSAAEFRGCLEKHHGSLTELLVGFYKKASGKAGLTYAEAVDELLCFGWIDGVKRRVDQESYTHRVTPRKAGSTWSNVNVGHVARLTKAGKMHPAGLKAFEARRAWKTGIYSYERCAAGHRSRKFPVSLQKAFQKNRPAWLGWLAQPPGYQRLAVHWVTSAKREDTRWRRLAALVAITARGKRLGAK